MENKEQQERIKYEGAKHGTIRQKMMSFRLDNDLSDWVSHHKNKGRYINNLIREDMTKQQTKQ